MKKYIKRRRITTINEIETVTCNKCGKQVQNTGDLNLDFNTFQNFEIEFGFGSDFDMTRMYFDLCDNCMIEFIKSFKVPPDRNMFWEADYQVK